MKIQQGCLVDISYRIAEPGGDVLESSDEEGPMTVEIGSDDLPAALDAALEGKTVGDEIEVSLAAGEAFGAHDPDGLVPLSKSDFPDDVAMEVGKWIVKRVGGRKVDFPSYRDLKTRELWPELSCETARNVLGWKPCDEPSEFLRRMFGK